MIKAKNKMDCVCKWNDEGEVISFCGAHAALHHKTVWPLQAELKAIKKYAATQHPLVSSQSCPLCTWDWEDSKEIPGWRTGKRTKECGYHYALNQLYTTKI